jgi:hypothetical protein
MSKEHERNENWIARDQGRIHSKGRQAAERASAGLGTVDDDPFETALVRPKIVAPDEPVPRRPGLTKQ